MRIGENHARFVQVGTATCLSHSLLLSLRDAVTLILPFVTVFTLLIKVFIIIAIAVVAISQVEIRIEIMRVVTVIVVIVTFEMWEMSVVVGVRSQVIINYPNSKK